MSKSKFFALLLSGGVLLALGLNCLPNIGGGLNFQQILNNLLGGQ